MVADIDNGGYWTVSPGIGDCFTPRPIVLSDEPILPDSVILHDVVRLAS